MTSPPHPAPPAGADALPPRTTPTWEMELLLSGATVFALLQAYGWLAPRGVDLLRLSGARLELVLAPLLLYLQAAMLALAGGFLLHLLLRAYWIALVGLRSVDPDGSVRHSVALGPWSRERVGAAWDALPQRIAALDDRATVVFAVSLGLSRLMGQLFLYASIMVLLALAVDAASGGRAPAPEGFLVLAGLLLLPFVVAVAIDNRAGRRGIATAPLARRVLAVYDRIGMTAQHNLSLQVLVHRIAGGGGGRARGMLAMIALMFVLMFATSVLPLALRGELGDRLRAGFPLLSIGDHASVRGVHYDDRAAGAIGRRVPSIPSAQVDGAWLPLFIPWVDLWHAEAFDACRAPHGDGWRADAARARAVLDCMAAKQPITLDGQPLAVAWHLIDDPLRDRRGFLAMIDLRSVPSGAHELAILPAPPGRNEQRADEAWRIPFWN